MARHVVQAHGLICREHAVVGRVDHALVERREHFRARQVDWCRARSGEDLLHQPLGRPHLQALEVGDAIQRHVGDERLQPRRRGADELEPVGIEQLVH